MATFYIESQTGRQVQVGDPSIDPNKFYIESGTGAQVAGSQLRVASTPPPPSQPPPTPFSPGGTTSTAPATPQTTPTALTTLPPISPTQNQPVAPTFFPSSGGGGSLSDFSNALTEMQNFVKQRRNASSVGMMTPYQGKLPASGFTGLLSNLNAASDDTTSSLINRAISAATPQYQVQQIGNDLFQMQYDSAGRFVGAQKIAANVSQTSAGNVGQVTIGNTMYNVQRDAQGRIIAAEPIFTEPQSATSAAASIGTQPESLQYGKTPEQLAKPKVQYGNFTYTEQEYQEDVALLQATDLYDAQGNPNRGSDGYVNPRVYYELYKQWVAGGGLVSDFVRLFPIKDYINPVNPLTEYPEVKALRGDKASPTTTSGGRTA